MRQVLDAKDREAKADVDAKRKAQEAKIKGDDVHPVHIVEVAHNVTMLQGLSGLSCMAEHAYRQDVLGIKNDSQKAQKKGEDAVVGAFNQGTHRAD